MKKILFCFLWMTGTVAITSAQEGSVQVVQVVEIVSVDTTIQMQPVCGHIPVSHWSIGFKTGANYYTMAPPARRQYDKLNLMVGGNIDCTINPLFGIGLEYNFNDYSRPYSIPAQDGSLKGGTHDVILYGSTNLSNALSPFRTGFWQNLNIYGDAGVGVSDFYFDLNGGGWTSNSINAPITMLGKLGLNAEFTLNKSINLSFEGQYRLYDTPRMGGAVSTNNNDAFIATIGLRYKFATSKQKHTRNISLCEYSPRPVPVIIQKVVKGDTQETINRLDASEKENAALKQKMQDDAKNAAIQKSLEAQNAALKQDRNNEKNIIILNENSTLQQKLDKMEQDLKDLSTKKEGVVNASFETIEFKSGSSELTQTSTQLLDQISGILINNSFWTGLKVYGHTDNIGSSAYNQRLSESRALSVKKYLMSKGVSTSNVIAIGMGENKPIDTNDTPQGRQNNRRVEFEITK